MSNSKLTINDFSLLPDFASWEEKIADFWDEEEIFVKSLEQTQVDPEWIFYDGPPFATGLPHYGHLLASTTKDVLPRFKTMQGFHVGRRWGWDCHGLPIENIIEKELHLHDRPSIEKYGVDKFCDNCRNKVQLYADEWKVIIRRLGRFVDMENDYKTMDPEFMESVWWVFAKLWEKDLIYLDYKPMHICPRCSTPLSNFEVTQGYKDTTDISIYVKMLMGEPEALHLDKTTYLVAWTTTPWTLPGNLLLAVDNETEYSVVALEENPDEYLIIATARLEETLVDKPYKTASVLLGSELVGRKYTPVFPYFASTADAFRVVDADFVTTDDGTGIVHIAPAFGEDDFKLGKREGLPIIHHVDMNGRFTNEVTDFAGELVKPSEDPLATDVKIIKYLATQGTLLRKQKVKHSYPHCWRCDTPLLNYATSSYFVSVSKLKEALLRTNDEINWQPAHMKYGRFGQWLEGARDWAISRNRFWGTPLPLWRSEDGDYVCIESIKQLEELTGEKVTDLHKPMVDKLVIEKDGKRYTHIPEVLDCWFESGSMPYASCHYPFANSESFDSFFPADFISEGQDQTRGWFYTLHVLATALTTGEKPTIKVDEGETSAFKNVLVNGIILAEDGKKMSKKLQNYPDPLMVINKYGADTLRFYLMSSPVMKAENLNFNEKDLANLRRRLIVILWNVFAFYKNVTPDDIEIAQNWDLNWDKEELAVLDKWLLAKLATLIEKYTQSLTDYDLPTAGKLILEFVDELSTWYLRLSRERLKEDEKSRQVFGAVIYNTILLLAPLTPFFTELIYQNLTPFKTSIHLEKWPEVKEFAKFTKPELIKQMDLMQKVTEKAHQVRKNLGIRVRQPLAEMIITYKEKPTEYVALDKLLALELNVKKITWQIDPNADLDVEFDTNLTEELKAEGEARELMRTISSLRKEKGLKPSEAWEYEVEEIPAGWQAEIERKTNTKLQIR